eukprot:CAMPEP_0203968954 /NCGR_PEP_ID=MMETSP0359-20131031/97214_1 /ASSEMBLY_ACC=CAM_ASM_000338 /TAXON_ID=268821 /ORGANISM="Scrippsiella Hangoei, Strain SHTV-5" /LENGTH=227 /DNA_ID=CAMNT_0050906889 /DNA_START=78 /DNA_END=761 /DNA_ORIENTATION=-
MTLQGLGRRRCRSQVLKCRSRPGAAVAALLLLTAAAAAAVVGRGSSCTAWLTLAPRGLRPHNTCRRAQEDSKLKRCPGCGRAQREDCDGAGHVVGALGQLLPDFQIKAYKECPRWVKAKGSSPAPRQTETSTIFSKEGFDFDNKVALSVPATWRALTRIKLREDPDIEAGPSGDFLTPYEKFRVVDVIRRAGQYFLKLEGEKKGWAFDRGIAGSWLGRPIAERISDN